MLLDRYDTSSQFSVEQILQFIKRVDNDFVPKLSDRVNLEDYTKKIVERACIFIAHTDNIIQGMVAFYLDRSNNQGYLTFMGVAVECRGTGVGSALLEKAIDTVRASGIKYFRTQTWSTNDRALKWYLNNGFKITGEAPDRANGVISVFLELEL